MIQRDDMYNKGDGEQPNSSVIHTKIKIQSKLKPTNSSKIQLFKVNAHEHLKKKRFIINNIIQLNRILKVV